jgi:formylglycine-generating enzyme required for sulfatase activity
MSQDDDLTPDLYARVHTILAEGRHLSGPELDSFLAKECGDDAELLSRIRELLELGDDDVTDAFSENHVRAARRELESMLDQSSTWMPERIGDFAILKRIGQGGMGVVYEAEQDSPRRRVAIKLMHPMQTTPERMRRFGREIEVLGRLQHPGIAQIFEVGTFDAGRGEQPFFAMELVEGVDVRTYCEREHLDLRARIELLAGVAEAVQYAHERGVVHRDLKPDNVLVDEQARPRVLDFGIARMQSQTSTLSTMTSEGQLVGTLAYMAPEVLKEEKGAVTPQVDVYALGVLGYELLVGHSPHRVEGLHLPQVVAVLTRGEPPRAGTSDTRLRGDVETILGKALASETNERYATAAALAGDLRRYLADEPILARPPSRTYLLRKFTRRNKALVAGVLATLLVSVVGAVVATRLAVQAQANFELAEKRRKEAEANEAEATRRADEVLRLSALQDYDEQLDRADELWPAHPDRLQAYQDWIADARALVADLPLHRSKRDELREGALAQSEEEREADRRAHPDFARLEVLPAEIASRRAALSQRRDGVEAEPFEPAWSALPSDATALNALAWPLVKPDREVFDREAESLALAERALVLARETGDGALVATIGNTRSRALFALGRDTKAREASAMAAAAAPDERREEFAGYLAELEDSIAEVRSEAGFAQAEDELVALAAEVRELESRVTERQTWRFPETDAGREARWWHANLNKLIASLEGWHEATGLLSERGDAVSAEHGWSVPRRLRFAERLRDGLSPAGEWHGRWAAATAAIAAHPGYGGLELSPQVGLVPIGPDPESGLWEFWHVATGAEPERDAEGKLVLTEATGVVLVLIPGASFWMGASTDPEAEHNHDPQAQSDEGPVHEVTLSAYFLSKYEMTQAQWELATGTDPAYRTPLTRDYVKSRLHPVEQVSWSACNRELERKGLRLPTEAQWEHGCRAGSTEARPFGDADFASYANVKDRSFVQAFSGPDNAEAWEDGFPAHGPVGSLRPNDLGLHDVLGNVWEWCLDAPVPDFYRRSGMVDPLAEGQGVDARVSRGGSFNDTAANTRAAIRHNFTPSFASYSRGVRPARVISE